MSQPEPVWVIVVDENGRPYETTLESILYAYRRTRVRDALEKAGVPYWAQPWRGKQCVRLLAEKWGYVECKPRSK